MKKRLKDKPLLIQIETVFLICIFVTLAIDSFYEYQKKIDNYMTTLDFNSRNMAHYAIDQMQDSYDMDWLIPYWMEHYGEMDIIYNDDQAEQEKRKLFIENNNGYDIYDMTSEQIESLSEESQRLYAELCYTELVLIFDGLKQIYHPMYLSCYTFLSEEEYFYIVTGVENGDVRGSEGSVAYLLGTTSLHDPSDRPILRKTLETRSEQLEIEHKKKTADQNGMYHIYVPLKAQSGEVLAIIDVIWDEKAIQSEIIEMIRESMLMLWFMLIICGVVLVVCVKKVVLNPIEKIQTNVNDYHDHKNSKRIIDSLNPMVNESELGQLSSDIVELAIEMDRYTEEVRKLAGENERIGTELHIASQIQSEIIPNEFPAFPNRKEFDIYAIMDPAKEVGGDFYDFFLIDEDHIALVIADVSGKGVPAALFMMVAKTLLKSRCQQGGSPAEIIYDVNNQLSEKNEMGLFVTAWFAIIELSSGKMVTSNAGHEYPVIKHADGDFEIIRDKHGAPLGAFEDTEYEEMEFELTPGDCIFVYTDGVAEATNIDGMLWGEHRMVEALNMRKDLELKELLTEMKETVDAFTGEAEQFDDITMLGFKYVGMIK